MRKTRHEGEPKGLCLVFRLISHLMCDPIEYHGQISCEEGVYELVTLFLVITATFFLIAGAPGDP